LTGKLAACCIGTSEMARFKLGFPRCRLLNRHAPGSRAFEGYIPPRQGAMQRNLTGVDCISSQIVGLAAARGWNASRGLHPGTLRPSSPATFAPIDPHVGAGGTHRRVISVRMSANICRGTATSAIWNHTCALVFSARHRIPDLPAGVFCAIFSVIIIMRRSGPAALAAHWATRYRNSAFIRTAVRFRPNRPLPAPVEDEQFCPTATVQCCGNPGSSGKPPLTRRFRYSLY
jgi:hypothetical protein